MQSIALRGGLFSSFAASLGATGFFEGQISRFVPRFFLVCSVADNVTVAANDATNRAAPACCDAIQGVQRERSRHARQCRRRREHVREQAAPRRLVRCDVARRDSPRNHAQAPRRRRRRGARLMAPTDSGDDAHDIAPWTGERDPSALLPTQQRAAAKGSSGRRRRRAEAQQRIEKNREAHKNRLLDFAEKDARKATAQRASPSHQAQADGATDSVHAPVRRGPRRAHRHRARGRHRRAVVVERPTCIFPLHSMHAALKQRWFELEAEKAQRSQAHARSRRAANTFVHRADRRAFRRTLLTDRYCHRRFHRPRPTTSSLLKRH